MTRAEFGYHQTPSCLLTAEDNLHRSFHQQPSLPVDTAIMQRRHVLMLAFKRNHINPSHARCTIARIHTRFGRRSQQCTLGRVAMHHPASRLLLQSRVVA